ncbi:MAG: GntR family transcriptional regulator [Proteobacteria bacterium]|nr:GntR family transcriptional regulator [Pseudomonadota bacterium]MBU1581949.1 GntR family transcriptional regulator [Pseudomonadota bacterium]MBU2453799.1 GntR family transcriptional regulator [Pseudomonadota bacterium]MBU2627363.1 GntR family transcriptional regulator [Pseudomonadota bacterium]
MDITIIKNFPIGIKEQLKRQIKTMIEDGQIKVGDMLLSAKDMGLFLNINRNTVAAAYKELEQEGFLDVIKGSGTFVKKNVPTKNREHLKKIFTHAYEQAVESGFTTQSINNFFITQLLEKSKATRKAGNVILIDCNYEVLECLDKKIKMQCDVESHYMLIQDIEKFPGKFVKRAKTCSFILCGMNHMEELKKAVPDLPVETIGFLIKTDFQITNQIMQLPAGTKVGYCCLTKKSARAFFKTTLFSSGSSLNRIHVGISDTKGIQTMLDSCDIIFATHYVYDTLVENFSTKKKIHRVDLDIDPGSLDFIISRLIKGGTL